MTSQYQRDDLDGVIADLRKRVRTLEAITPPPAATPPTPQPNYGPRYISWTPNVTLDGVGTPPTFDSRSGIGVATFKGAAGLWFLHCQINIDIVSAGGTAGVDWVFELHTSYPRTGQYTIGAAFQNFLGYGRIYHHPFGVDHQGLYVRAQAPASGGNTGFRVVTNANVVAQSLTPWTWDTSDGLIVFLDYWSPGP